MLAALILAGGGVAASLLLRDGTPGTADLATGPTTPVAVETSAGPPAPVAPVDVATEQAGALDRLLDASVVSRGKLGSAISRVEGCSGLAGAIDDLGVVGDERRSQLQQLAVLDLSALADGERLRATLARALQQSLYADESFVSWARYVANSGCPGGSAPHNPAYADGQAYSTAAGTAKNAFIALWNPVAIRFGLPARSRDTI
ncbi:hypothetical protein [Catellatospora sp. NPDC049609]|uniref:hypothetical protein n=1 Tax=Catellatospora sp. NPDC049609 TaxID=3155505 RepID=UPI00342E6248